VNLLTTYSLTFSSAVWGKMLVWMGYMRHTECWQLELQRLIRDYSNNSAKHQLYRMAIVVSIYHLWKERNRKQQSKALAPPVVERREPSFGK